MAFNAVTVEAHDRISSYRGKARLPRPSFIAPLSGGALLRQKTSIKEVSVNIKDLCEKAHENAKAKGWHEKKVTIPEYISNIHGEVSEAFEEYRNGCNTRKIYINVAEEGKPLGFPVEIADVVIRIADMCEAEGIDLEKAIKLKMEYNKTRSYRHGGKLV